MTTTGKSDVSAQTLLVRRERLMRSRPRVSKSLSIIYEKLKPLSQTLARKIVSMRTKMVEPTTCFMSCEFSRWSFWCI